MKTLAQPEVLAELQARIAQLSPADQAAWGTMSVDQMICHVRDAYQMPLSTRRAAPIPMPAVQRALFKKIALRAPVKWPPGVKTVPEVEQGVGGTPPTNFDADRAALLSALAQFAAAQVSLPHPIFGTMSPADWQRWGFLHADHHLRQFRR